MAEPVIDVSTVTVFPTRLPCAVYGDITAYDKLDLTLPTYELYSRDAEHAEVISEPGQALSVIGLDKILFMQQPVMSLSLKAVKNDTMDDDVAFIARGIVDLDIDTNNDYEEVKQSDVKGDCGMATVNYIALSCALVAHTSAFLSDYSHVAADVQGQALSQQASDLNCSLYGSIVAHYGKTFGHVDHFRIPLLNVSSDQSIPIFFEGCSVPVMKLTRNYVALPAYSSLNIKANLRSTLSSMPVVDEEDTIILWPKYWRGSPRLDDDEIPPQCTNVFKTSTDWDEPFDLQPSSRLTKRKSVDCGGKILFELFSVFIGRENDHDVKVTGTITLHDDNSHVVIFNRNDSNPDHLVGGKKLLTITCPSILEFFSPLIDSIITVNLNVDDRRFIENEEVDFGTTFIEDWELEFDRPLCAVLNSDNGYYCALHYSMFMSAARVDLKIVLLCKGVDVAKVHGKIVAWSDIFDYTRDYDKRYYRRALYNELDDQVYYPREVAPEKTVQSSSEHNLGVVELSESCVAVPLAFNFNIGVDLYASSRTSSSPTEHLHKTFSFHYTEDKPMMEIVGADFDIHIKKN